MKISNFWLRLITGVFFVLFIVALTYINEYTFLLLLLLISTGALVEFYQIVFKRKTNIKDIVFVLIGIACII
jgi:CDP-diglyceride synthetase